MIHSYVSYAYSLLSLVELLIIEEITNSDKQLCNKLSINSFTQINKCSGLHKH